MKYTTPYGTIDGQDHQGYREVSEQPKTKEVKLSDKIELVFRDTTGVIRKFKVEEGYTPKEYIEECKLALKDDPDTKAASPILCVFKGDKQ